MTFGPMLSAYSRDVTQHAFRNVVVHSTVQSAANTADLILYPKFMKFEYSGNDKHLMVLEWTAKDKSGKNIVWFSTVKGQADSKGQSRADLRKRQQILVDDLSEKTLKAFLESPELKRIAAQLKESNPPLR